MNIKIIESSDGSHTLYLPDMNETYHSTHGALQESYHVYIKNGLLEILGLKDQINILEVGFGTGLNCLPAIKENKSSEKEIYYRTFEPFPLSAEIYEKLNFPQLEEFKGMESVMNSIHTSDFGKSIIINSHFIFEKIKEKIQNFNIETDWADLVFYDAFAPGKQPEMWEVKVFEKLFSGMKKGGLLVTYCASGQFKRNLKAAGFEIESLQGPPGKKEMTRALKE